MIMRRAFSIPGSNRTLSLLFSGAGSIESKEYCFTFYNLLNAGERLPEDVTNLPWSESLKSHYLYSKQTDGQWAKLPDFYWNSSEPLVVGVERWAGSDTVSNISDFCLSFELSGKVHNQATVWGEDL